jgi:hypothetical protein
MKIMRKRRIPASKPPELLRLAAAIARQHPWCDPKRVSECHGCACRKDARAQLRASRRSRTSQGN